MNIVEAEKMLRFHNDGLISDEILLLYGIAGVLPDRNKYNQMTSEERAAFWNERLSKRLGTNWRQRFNDRDLRLPQFIQHLKSSRTNWQKEGF